MLPINLLPTVFSVCFLIPTRTTCTEMPLSVMSWAPTLMISKKNSFDEENIRDAPAWHKLGIVSSNDCCRWSMP